VGAAGAGVAAAVVLIAAGADARFDTEKLKGPPFTFDVVFRTATVAGFAVLVKLQVICAAGSTFAAGTVNTFPARLPKLPGLPVKLELASLQVADVASKLVLAASVTCTCVLTAETWMAVGATGAAVLAAVVEILEIAEARFVAANVNGPPNPLVVIFCKANVGGFGAFVKVQTIRAKVLRFTTGMVITLPASVPKLAGLPDVAALVSVQTPVLMLKLVFAASVKVTGLRMLLTGT
jgi:hypothetical protein